MNEKRFSWKTEKLQHSDDEVLLVVDNENKEWKGHILNIVDLLNGLSEENKQLKKEHKIAIDEMITDYKNLEKEKEQLKKQFKRYEDGLWVRFTRLEKENEQLKEENKYLKKRIKVISDELYCKDRKLEELGVPIECCDNDE